MTKAQLRRMLNEHAIDVVNPETDCYHCLEMIALEDRAIRARFSVGDIDDKTCRTLIAHSITDILNEHARATIRKRTP